MHHDGGMRKTIQEFLAAASHDASFREMGRITGINHSTIRRQLTGEGELTAPVVVEIARAYEADVIEALIAAGFISFNDANKYAVGASLKSASDKELAQEILRRAMTGEATETLTAPMSTGELIVGRFGEDVEPTDMQRAAFDDDGDDGEDDSHI